MKFLRGGNGDQKKNGRGTGGKEYFLTSKHVEERSAGFHRSRERAHVLRENQRSRLFALRAQNTFDLALPYY